MKILGKFFASFALVVGLLAGVVAFDAAPGHAAAYDTGDVRVATDAILQPTAGGYTVRRHLERPPGPVGALPPVRQLVLHLLTKPKSKR